MYKFKKSLIALIGLISLVALATVATPHLGYGSSAGPAAPSQTQNVNVVNTPTVNAQQSGSWNVKIDDTDPLPVRDVDNPVRQPFEASIGVNIPDQNFGAFREVATVPAGTTLVLEHISIESRMQNQKLASAFVQSESQVGFGPEHHLIITDQGMDFLGREVSIVSQDIRLYFRAGAKVIVTVERNSTVGLSGFSVARSGYLVSN